MMGCETQAQHEQRTTLRRPMLFRMEDVAGATDLQDDWKRIAAAGFDGIELPLHASTRAETDADTTGEPPLPASFAENGIPVGAVAARCDTTDVEAAVAKVGALLDQATLAHARCLNLTIPPIVRETGRKGFASYQDALNFAYELLRFTRFEAEAAGVAIALEAGANDCLLSPVEFREIINAANSWAVGACLDVTRIARIGSPADWITTLKHRVHAVRLGDIGTATAPPPVRRADASSPPAIAAVLDTIGYEGPVIAIGCDDPETMRAFVSTLRCGMSRA